MFFQSPLFGKFIDKIHEILNDKRGVFDFWGLFSKPIYHEGFIQWGSAVFSLNENPTMRELFKHCLLIKWAYRIFKVRFFSIRLGKNPWVVRNIPWELRNWNLTKNRELRIREQWNREERGLPVYLNHYFHRHVCPSSLHPLVPPFVRHKIFFP